jgi:hypothetical protein
MASKAVITAPVPTVHKTAREMGVGKERVQQLRRLVTAIVHGSDGRIARFLAGETATPGARKTRARFRVAKRKQTARR